MSEEKSLISAEVQARFYGDAISKPAVVVGNIAEDIAKSFRLVLAPIQLMALAQDRLGGWLDKIRSEVPIERQVEAAPEIAGPILMNLRFIDDSNTLKDLYLNLLKASIDSDRSEEVHPGFVKVLEHLSPTDALLFSHVYSATRLYSPVCVAFGDEESSRIALGEWNTVPQQIAELQHIKIGRLRVAFELFESLNLLTIANTRTVRRLRFACECRLTSFGNLFAKVCLPDVFQTQSHETQPTQPVA